MIKLFARKRKTLTAVMSAAFVATAFQPGSCTVNLDEELLGQVLGLIGDLQGPGLGPRWNGPRHDGPDFECEFDSNDWDGNCDERWDDQSDGSWDDDGHDQPDV